MDLTVIHKGKPAFNLNKAFVEKQGLSEADVKKIKSLHVKRLDIFDKMKVENDVASLKSLASEAEECEFALQEIWGFEKDAAMHLWYKVPQCDCPKLDNAERRGSGYKIINEKCKIHGKNS
ncbi:hypothetical protein [Serratia sp. Se-RSBMAAmG]|uniref:hypothetical protein n=1 Tax=Serratia sp. Se-RSBMAAmG TaxID=3043305 RepID=UPI0024AEDFB2|nr:hypothetical protein [Serratia sp. Se-RSBMAAmG]MDI6976078.1 hypothetical protein [Serratia sp. Se-RSBMAAmG]